MAPRRRAGGATTSTAHLDPSSSTPLRPFFACYLVVSLDPLKKGRSYVGFTNDPPRRLAQHNGVIANGARYTSLMRPCDMILIVSGFASKTQALQFEWAWQNPARSRATREAAERAKITDRSIAPAKKAELMCLMLEIAPWRHMSLTVHCMSDKAEELIERHRGRIPAHVTVRRSTTRELENIVAMSAPDNSSEGGESESVTLHERDLNVGADGGAATPSVSMSTRVGGARCGAETCGEIARLDRSVGCPTCGARFHATCLARYFFKAAGDEALSWPSQLIPKHGPCAKCGVLVPSWGAALSAGQQTEATLSQNPKTPKPSVVMEDDGEVVTSGNKRDPITSTERKVKERARVHSWAANVEDELEESDDDDDDDNDDDDVVVSLI